MNLTVNGASAIMAGNLNVDGLFRTDTVVGNVADQMTIDDNLRVVGTLATNTINGADQITIDDNLAVTGNVIINQSTTTRFGWQEESMDQE
jgi:hypothetical protein